MEAQWESELHYNEDPAWTADSGRMTPHRIIPLAEDEDSGGGGGNGGGGGGGVCVCTCERYERHDSLRAVTISCPLRTPPPPPVAL